MKPIFKILSLVFVLGICVSCDRDTGETDYLNNRTNTLFFAKTSGTILVEDGAENIYEIVVGATANTIENLPYTITVDDASTAVENVDFTILNSSTVVNKNNIVSTIRIQADFENASVDGKKLILNLTSTDANVSAKNSFSLELIKLCPIDAPFVGEYQLTTTVLGIFDTPTFTDGIVTIEVGDTPTDRVFNVTPYPAFGAFPEISFTFSLICNNVVVPGFQFTGVGCGSSTSLGPVVERGTYNPADDSQFNIKFADDEGGASCGEEVAAEILLTKL